MNSSFNSRFAAEISSQADNAPQASSSGQANNLSENASSNQRGTPDKRPIPDSKESAHLDIQPLLTATGVIAPLLLFGFLAEDVATREDIRFDTPFLLWLHAHATPRFDQVMLAFTAWGGVRVLLMSFLLCAVLFWRRQRVQAYFLLWAMVGTSLLNVAVKAAFERVRPDLWLSLAPEQDYGFPSGHSMLSCAFVLAVLVLTWKSRSKVVLKWAVTGVGLLFLLGVGLSRLYLGVHYPSDVLAGFSLVLSWITLLQGILEKRLGLTQR